MTPFYKIATEGDTVNVVFQESWLNWYNPPDFTVGKTYQGQVHFINKDACISFNSDSNTPIGEIWINEGDNYEFIEFN